MRLDGHRIFSLLTCIWFFHSLSDALLMEDGDCMTSMRGWLVVSFVTMATFRLVLKVGQKSSHAKENFVFSLRQESLLPRVLIAFIWGFLLPFSAAWTGIGTTKFYEAMTHKASCSSAGTQPWLVAFWQLLSYTWLSIYLFYFCVACTIECRMRMTENNMRLIETPDTLSRWGHLLPASLTAEPFISTELLRAQRGMQPEDIKALPDVEMYEDDFGMGNDMHCSICLSDFCKGDRIRPLPGCGHCFHQSCVDLWLLRCADCPLCKNPVKLD